MTRILLSFAILILILNLLYGQNREEIFISEDIQLISLQDSVFIHESWHNSKEFGRFPSNGLIVVKNGEALMIDSPMDIQKTRKLYHFLQDSMGIQVVEFIACHSHDDCMGGLEYLHNKKVHSLANIETKYLCEKNHLPIPKATFRDSLNFDFNGRQIECFYPGPGHTFDNIVVLVPENEILFGGCLIKSERSRNLGNLEDAVVEEWNRSVEKLINWTGDKIKVLVPGHGQAGGSELFYYTISLIEKHKSK